MTRTIAIHPRLMDRLTAEEQARLRSCAALRRLPRGAGLFHQGSALHELYIVLRGRIRVFHTSEQGNALTFAYWSEGTLVGTPGVRHVFEHRWNAEAAVESELLAISGEHFATLMHHIPALCFAVIEALEFKASRLANLAQILATSSVAERLKMLLLNLVDLYGANDSSGVVITVPFTHEEIAGMVGASRPWVSTMMTRMRSHGLLDAQRGRMRIPDPAVLQAADFNALR